MLIGEYSVSVGEKNRVAIPKKLRIETEGRLLITRGYEGCLIIIDDKRWNKILTTVNSNSIFNNYVRDTKRYLLGAAITIEIDNQGRFVIPETLKEFANIQEKAVFVGIEDWIELWDESKWKEKLNSITAEISETAKKLIQNG